MCDITVKCVTCDITVQCVTCDITVNYVTCDITVKYVTCDIRSVITFPHEGDEEVKQHRSRLTCLT